jgi:long-chain acyl-CoA synthetase
MKRSVLSALNRAADHFGEAPVAAEGGLTYRDLAGRVAAATTGMAGLGLRAGDVAGVLMGNSISHLELCFAVPGSGAVLADLDGRRSLADLVFMVDDAGMSALFVDDAHAAVGSELKRRCPELSRTILYDAETNDVTGSVPRHDVEEGSLAAICYSGTPGADLRGVMLSHANLLHRALQIQAYVGLRSADRYLHAVPMSDPGDLALSYLATWVGARHSFVDEPSSTAVREIVEGDCVSATLLEPGMATMLLDDPQTYGADLSSLRVVLCDTGVTSQLQRQIVDLLGCDVHRFYGRTEFGPVLELSSGVQGTGLATAGTSVTLRRADGRTPAGAGEPGEITVRGPNVMLGYWNRPDDTSRALSEGGWYRTGDLAVSTDEEQIQLLEGSVEVVLSGDRTEAGPLRPDVPVGGPTPGTLS